MINTKYTTDKLGGILDNLFNSSLSDIIGTDFVSDTPAVNITESDVQHNIIIAATGFQKTDFNIKVDKDQLIVSTELDTEKKDSESKFLRREFSYGSFKRSFHLPETIDRENISATYENGLLNITIKKKNKENEDTLRTVEIV